MYKTEYGPIYAGGRCNDTYANIVERDGRKLQRPAQRALREAERRLYVKHHPRAAKWFKNKREKIPLTGSWRSCKLQRQLWESDKSRYAHPDTTLHTRGLAIDVHTGYITDDVNQVLTAHGWNRSRPTDEPWHWSYHLMA